MANRNYQSRPTTERPRKWLLRVFQVFCVAMLIKAFALILFEYRYYFPLDFQRSRFLHGREESFTSLYYCAFYVHLFVAPLSLILGLWLYFGRDWQTRWHPLLGRVQTSIILVGVAPSGLVMATATQGGPMAAAGFIGLSITTAISTTLCIRMAINGRLRLHQQWATRCLLCLLSPIVLRMYGGFTSLISLETIAAYQFISWGSWLIPLLIYQLVLQTSAWQQSA